MSGNMLIGKVAGFPSFMGYMDEVCVCYSRYSRGGIGLLIMIIRTKQLIFVRLTK